MSYTPKTWVDGEVIYHQDLNHIEQGIKDAHDELSLKPDSSELGSAAFKDVPTSGDASSEQVVLGSDTRMNNARPASDVFAWAKQQNKPSYDYSEINNPPDLSDFITKSVNDLTNYYLKSETYTKAEVAALIGAIQQFHYEIYVALPASGESNVLYFIGPTGTGTDKYEEYVYTNNTWTKIGDTSIDLSDYVTISALNTALADYTTTANLTTLLAGKQDTIDDLATIRSGAAAGATAVQPTGIKTINNQSIVGNGNLTGKDLGLVDLPDNSINELEGRTFITTQEEFDQMIADANAEKAVNAVLGNGTFIVKSAITKIRKNFILIGSKDTVLKRNNRTFTRIDADTSSNTDTHWACAVREEPVQPFSIFLDGNNDYVKISEYAHVCYTTEPFMNENGESLTSTLKSEIFYIPKGDIDIPATQLPYVYGYVDCAWSITKFVLTGNIVNITKSGTSTVVECFEAQCLPNAASSSTRTQTANPNYYRSSDRRGLNSFVLFNTGTDGNLYYNGTHIMVPNAFNSIEVVDGWHYFNSFDASDFGGRPQYFIGPNTRGYNSDKVIIEGITFRNFQNVIYLSESFTNDNVIQMHGFTVRDCVFEKCTARAINTILAARTGMFNQKEKSYITNCKFVECGLSNYKTLNITARNRLSNGGNKNCLATGIEWISIEDCEVCGSVDGRVQYKNTGLVGLGIDGTMKRCLLSNVGRSHISIDYGNVKVESCELFNTERFNADKERNASSDGGMIYINGANNMFNPEVVIKDNVFHDGIDMNGVNGSFKAIYIDEGRTNVLVQDNVVYNCMGSGIGARVTNNGVMNFYGWTNDNDVIYTNTQTGKGLSAVFTVNSQTYELEFTGDFIDFAPLNSPSEITYDSKTWTYDSTKDIADTQWSSANVRYVNNIVEGTMTIKYGDDVPSTLTPVASGNIQLGTFGAGFGSDSSYDSIPPYNKNDVYDNTNKVVNDYYINNGVHVDEDTYVAASANMKKKLFYDKGFVKPVGIKTVSYDNATTAVVQQMVSNIVYDCSELSELTISVPSSVDINYISQINFTSGSTATQLTAPATIVWDGDSIDTNGLFVPEANMRYTVMLYSDGRNVLGIVRGTAITTTQNNNE